MILSIYHLPHLDRPFLLKRENGKYKQHAHFFKRKDAEKVRSLIKYNRYPYSEEYKKAMQRLLTEEEFKGLNKKQRYLNVNNGNRRNKKY